MRDQIGRGGRGCSLGIRPWQAPQQLQRNQASLDEACIWSLSRTDCATFEGSLWAAQRSSNSTHLAPSDFRGRTNPHQDVARNAAAIRIISEICDLPVLSDLQITSRAITRSLLRLRK